MAHFAKIGAGNIVEQVIVVSNDIATTEQAGIDFLNNLYKDRIRTFELQSRIQRNKIADPNKNWMDTD